MICTNVGAQRKQKMPKINFEKIVKADRKRVFDITANYEEFQKIIPNHFPSIHVRSKRNNVAVVEEHRMISDKELIMMTKHVTKYPEIHEVFVIGGDAKGSHIVEKYESIPEGTKITVNIDLKLKGRLRLDGLFGKEKINKDFMKMIDDLAKIAES